MKKFYALAVVLALAIGSATAQTNYYWIGGSANGNWNIGTNWSNTSGGPAANAYPQLPGDNVIFDGNATVTMNLDVIINSLSVTGTNTSVKIVTATNTDGSITVNSTNAGSPGLLIAATCRLEQSATDGSYNGLIFAEGGQGVVNGDWYFTIENIESDDYAYSIFPTTGALNINNGGSVTFGQSANPFADGNTFLRFNSGSSLNLLGKQSTVPEANYNAASTINITGVENAGPSFEEFESVGNINYNCPLQSNLFGTVYLGLDAISVKGDLNILNTNGKELAIIGYTSTSGLPSRNATVEGNLNIQGNSVVSVAHNGGPDVPNNLNVYGNVIVNGSSLSLHTGSNISDAATTLRVKGNIQHTAGTFGASSTVINQTTDLYIIELNGTTNQNISSVTGNFDNTNKQVTLKMNNAAGATLLTSLQVGRISFNSANKGILTTNANTLTINNTTPNSTATIVVNSPSSTGYVNGTVRRISESTEPMVIPVGSLGYRGVTMIPTSAATTTFQATYYSSGYADLSVASPLEGISPDYFWDISRIAGTADAAVQYSIPGAVTGSQEGYALVTAKYNGIDWVTVKGSTGIAKVPGTSTSGVLRSDPQSIFGAFTIGFGQQSALPTLLVSFTGKKSSKETIDLNWKITDNSTPSVFEVMRSADGVNFEKIGSIAGSDGVRSYNFADRSILAGNNYYRLKMLDRDGAVTYSTIVVVSNGAKGVYMNSITPSIVRSRTKLNIQSSTNTNMQLVVTDISGRIVHKQSVSLSNGSQDVWLDASSLSSGAFQVIGYTNGEKTATLRFIKL
jgi:hypothetical protein